MTSLTETRQFYCTCHIYLFFFLNCFKMYCTLYLGFHQTDDLLVWKAQFVLNMWRQALGLVTPPSLSRVSPRSHAASSALLLFVVCFPFKSAPRSSSPLSNTLYISQRPRKKEEIERWYPRALRHERSGSRVKEAVESNSPAANSEKSLGFIFI